jgi:hypothetical protein
MNKFIPDHDRDFVNFLQQNRPSPPKVNPHLETQLMELIKRQPQTSTKHFASFLWVVPGAIAIGLAITWSSQRFAQPTPQLAQEDTNLELFLSDNWKSALQESNYSTNFYFADTSDTENYQLIPVVKSPQVLSSAPFR